ncbi:MAG: ferredoxin family protein, partial [Thermodesulfobacteriota bacterium]
AGVYTLEEGGMINVAYEGCLECGSCRIGCPRMNIQWQFPRGGYGIRHKFG